MSVQVTTDNTTVPFLRFANPGAVKQDGIVAQDAGRSAPLAPFTVLGLIKSIIGTATADGSNTGNGTVTGLALGAGGPAKVGSYILTCTKVGVTHGGRFTLVDPDGISIATDLNMSDVASDTLTVVAGGLTFIITDGSTNFAADDFFTITVTAGAGYLPMDPAAVNGLESFAGISMFASLAAATIVAGTTTNRQILVADYYVDKNQLVFENSLTLATVLASGKTLEEEMASFGIFAEDTIDISRNENA